jgi:hypothetical protein
MQQRNANNHCTSQSINQSITNNHRGGRNSEFDAKTDLVQKSGRIISHHTSIVVDHEIGIDLHDTLKVHVLGMFLFNLLTVRTIGTLECNQSLSESQKLI